MPKPPSPHRQNATLKLRVGRRASLKLDISVTDRGLVAIGALVSSLLVSTALIVHAARANPTPARPGKALPPPA